MLNPAPEFYLIIGISESFMPYLQMCMLVIVLIHLPLIATYMCQWIGSVLFQIMACRLSGAKPLSKPTLGYGQLDP